MGPEARYYSSLTPSERDRVDKILLETSEDWKETDADSENMVVYNISQEGVYSTIIMELI
jgi:hypothetical protein